MAFLSASDSTPVWLVFKAAGDHCSTSESAAAVCTNLSWLLPPARPSLYRSPPRCRPTRCNLKTQRTDGETSDFKFERKLKCPAADRNRTGVLRLRVVVLVTVFLLLLLFVRRRVERFILHFRLWIFLCATSLRQNETRRQGFNNKSKMEKWEQQFVWFSLLCAERTSLSGSRKDQPPCSKKPSGSSTMVFMILVQFRDCTPSVYLMSHELRKETGNV